jgi:hypothetical protein
VRPRLPGLAGGRCLGQQGVLPLAGQRGVNVMADHFEIALSKVVS